MSIKTILEQLPPYASDISKSIKEIFLQDSNTLAKYQTFGITLTVGYALKHEWLLNYIRPEAKRYLDSNEANACKIAASTMSMTNTYYNFSKKINDEEIRKMSSLLSLENLNSHNIDEKDFSMYCLAASIINGCEYCINIHIKKLREQGCSPETIRDIGRIVSVIKAAGDVLEIERMRSYEFMVREENL
ncbi:carboxymuconolactone decarboxylase family protein [Candidatus Bandiella euplotis]|uniref:Alkyl hydroperoxide reductase AhpD n=1 Tax=Candidatus Bandiella euplotis TaxID=1664265 RepID=A0ABZ0UQP0_9RICK|nr:carboxymuconolactone decarboxylase family protein [Candidatus Bandiella woodruffii]WPX96350.1 Alkyl hydroperoxide reductase [Candidatus Bandiella woodruffii]